MDNLIAIALFTAAGLVSALALYRSWRMAKDLRAEEEQVHRSLFARGQFVRTTPTQTDSRYQATRIGFVLSDES